MHAETTRRRIPATFLWGAAVVLAWAALSLFSGADEAHGDDDSSTPLTSLTSLASDAVGEVVAPVVKTATAAADKGVAPAAAKVGAAVSTAPATTKAVPPVVEPVAKAIEKVPAVVKPVVTAVNEVVPSVKPVATVVNKAVPAVKPVAKAVDKTASVASKAGDAVKAGMAGPPVSEATKPVTDTVRQAPVVGAIVDGLGVTGLLDQVSTDVDRVLGRVAPITDALEPITDAVKPILDAVAPVIDGVAPVIDGVVPAPPHGSGYVPHRPGGHPPVISTPSTEADPSHFEPLSLVGSDALRIPQAGDAGGEFMLTATLSSSALGHNPTVVALPHIRGLAAPSGASDNGPPPGFVAPGSSAAGASSASSASSDAPLLAPETYSAALRSGIPMDADLPSGPAGSADVSPD